ncbi:MAG: hypothetical protein QM756_04945 [Polyangiaceae bacterium]
MLAFCAARLDRLDADEGERALSLEGFLLHYRNLIRFLSGKHHRRDDISTANCMAWAGRELTASETTAIRNAAAALDDAYDDHISKYLQHCTAARYEIDRSWDVRQMAAELSPIVEEFERAFPR